MSGQFKPALLVCQSRVENTAEQHGELREKGEERRSRVEGELVQQALKET